jgi:hypothetical protein
MTHHNLMENAALICLFLLAVVALDLHESLLNLLAFLAHKVGL